MKRAGITLLESLVVVAIVGALLALALPAIQRVRGVADRLACAANLRTLGQALTQYHADKGRLPPGCADASPGAPTPFMGWQVHLLPYLEASNLWREAIDAFAQEKYFQWVPPHHHLGTVVKEFTCPADPRLRRPHEFHSTLEGRIISVAFTSYLGVLGIRQTRNDGVLFYNSRIRFGDIEDGLSTTVMVGERPPSAWFNAGWWYAGSGMDQRGTGDMVLGVSEINTYPPAYYFRGPCEVGPYEFQPGKLTYQCDQFHFWSIHPGGGHFLFADGSTRFLRYTAKDVLYDLATRAGKERTMIPE